MQNQRELRAALMLEGYVPLEEAMLLAGYVAGEKDLLFVKERSPRIELLFDLEEEIAYKNRYRFPIAGDTLRYAQRVWIREERLSGILHCSFHYLDGILAKESITYAQNAWTTAFPPLVAHAGGGLRHSAGALRYTNSIEALIQNYNLGHRVFEFDFSLTSDYKLAAVHDWRNFGNLDGKPMSEAEWRAFVPLDGAYTTTMLDDILDEMMVNEDMFLITDTKSYEATPEEALLQFRCLYNEAIRRDPALLSRIIPQCYDEATFGFIMQTYDFPGVIYTLYASEATVEEVAAFALSQDRIQVVTISSTREDLLAGLPSLLAAAGKMVYVHTVNHFEDIIPLTQNGATGFYTDFITPESFGVYREVLRN
ncbi:MAG: hypothetical protein FWH28_05925 [Clostridiales bacterium]|nr:hypothetical protein [Clostridiales bacterium]